jgi:LPXTG-site transpeptidase (sortase) family protein
VICGRFLTFTGLLVLAVCAATLLYSYLGSAYDNWAFDQSLEHSGRITSPGTLQVTGAKTAAARTADSGPYDSPAEVKVLTAPQSQKREQGARIARLQIPSVGLSVMVLDGTKEWVLQRGAGHIEGTAYPGEPGNMAIAGHRDRSFRKLKNVTRNAWIVVETPQTIYRYKVQQISIVKPSDVSVLKAKTKPSLTLVTCYPFYYVGHAPRRYIIQARLVSQS